jgi:hypothetical protein
MLKNLSLIVVVSAITAATSVSYAQSARSLFSAPSGVSFESSANEAKSKPKTSASEKKSADNATQYLGVSYTIFKQLDNGSVTKTSPKTTFKTGDRIRVQLVPNTSGYLKVLNIDPKGNSSLLIAQVVQAGEPVSVPTNGYLKFVGSKGIEELVFILSGGSGPAFEQQTAQQIGSMLSFCSSQHRTRALVIDDREGNEFNVLNADGTCSTKPKNTNTRALVVDVEDNTGYGVVPKKTLQDGQVLSLKIKLRHN